MKWFRLYHSVIDSLKLRPQSDAVQLDYFYLLCCASEFRETYGGNTGETGLTVEKAAFRARRATLQETLPVLVKEGLCHVDKAGLIVIDDWDTYQFTSDDVNKRSSKFRHKARKTAPATPSATLPATEEKGIDRNRTDTEKKDTSVASVHNGGNGKDSALVHTPAAKKRAAGSVGKRLPETWTVTKSYAEAAMEIRPDWTPDDIRKVAEIFKDHWTAKTGKDATKTDWIKTWRNWVRHSLRDKEIPPKRKGGLSAAGAATVNNLKDWNPREG